MARVANAVEAIDSVQATRLLVTLLRSPAVQAELKLDGRQAAAVDLAVAEVDVPLWKLRDVPERQSAEAVRACKPHSKPS